jgi:hypothetical protein
MDVFKDQLKNIRSRVDHVPALSKAEVRFNGIIYVSDASSAKNMEFVPNTPFFSYSSIAFSLAFYRKPPKFQRNI